MPARTRSAQPSEPPIQAGRITRPTTSTKPARANATKNSTRQKSTKPRPRATKPTRKHAATSNEPVGDHSASEPQDDEPTTVGAPPPVPAYHPRVVVKGNNILLSGPWHVRKYSNDFENGKERLELDRLKATIDPRAVVQAPGRSEFAKTSSLEDFEEPGRKSQPFRQEGGNKGGHLPARPGDKKGKTAVYRLDDDHRYEVKHKDHGGGIFDPSVEDFDPMPIDRHHHSGRYSDTFTKEDDSYTWGYVGPQTGSTGGWHFLRHGGTDSDNTRARNLMGLKGFFEPDTLHPTASNVAAYREYLWAYRNEEPKIDNVTESIKIFWKESGPDPRGLADRYDDQMDPADEEQNDDEPGSVRDTDAPIGEPIGHRGRLNSSGETGNKRSQLGCSDRKESGGVSPRSVPQDEQEEALSTSVDNNAQGMAPTSSANKVDHTASKKRKSQAAADQQLDSTPADGAEEQSPPKRARHTAHGCYGEEAEGIPIVHREAAEKARLASSVDRKSLTDQAKKKGSHGNVGAYRKSEGTSGLISAAEFEKIYGRNGFK